MPKMIATISLLKMMHSLGKLQTSFQHASFLPSRSSFFTTFIKIAADIKALGSQTSYTEVGDKNGMLPAETSIAKIAKFCGS